MGHDYKVTLSSGYRTLTFVHEDLKGSRPLHTASSSLGLITICLSLLIRTDQLILIVAAEDNNLFDRFVQL